ncbi:hypothetical protein ON010_g18468 [Phytophthora cinnamomi]|nr:hypothetical protein ON010_g18468 [Phytophthora cinnamomi]
MKRSQATCTALLRAGLNKKQLRWTWHLPNPGIMALTRSPTLSSLKVWTESMSASNVNGQNLVAAVLDYSVANRPELAP